MRRGRRADILSSSAPGAESIADRLLPSGPVNQGVLPPLRPKMRTLPVISCFLWLAACAGSGHLDQPPVPTAVAAQAAPALDRDDARHLLTRTGFGPTPSEITALVGVPRIVAVDRLLASARATAVTPPPDGIDVFQSPAQLRDGDASSRRDVQRHQFELSIALRGWWLEEILHTPSPLTERMTLFWHNHFVSSQEKVKSPVLMYRQNVLLRRHAVGSFATLAHAIARDPAMVVYLDSAQNRKGAPNENFARELMELFTLGVGHYGEPDVKEAARAFTGWSIDRETGAFRFRPFAHDGGTKTLLGATGRFDGDAVIDMLLARPETAERIVSKLWREFVSPTPDAAAVTRVAARFRSQRYDIRVALRDLLLSDAFWDPANRGVLVKSPVDLVAGTLRTFEVETGDPAPFVLLLASLGQNLFSPPNVKGWPGGEDWIDATTLLARRQFLDRLFRGQDMVMAADRLGKGAGLGKGGGRAGPEGRQRLARALGEVRFDADRWLARWDRDVADGVAASILPLPPVEAPAPGTQGLELLRALTQDPVYQLR